MWTAQNFRRYDRSQLRLPPSSRPRLIPPAHGRHLTRTGGRTIDGPEETLTILETIVPWPSGLTPSVGASQISSDLGLAVILDAP